MYSYKPTQILSQFSSRYDIAAYFLESGHFLSHFWNIGHFFTKLDQRETTQLGDSPPMRQVLDGALKGDFAELSRRYADIFLAAGVVSIIGMMIIPLPIMLLMDVRVCDGHVMRRRAELHYESA